MCKIVNYNACKISKKDSFYSTFYAFQSTFNTTNQKIVNKIIEYLKQQKQLLNVGFVQTIVNTYCFSILNTIYTQHIWIWHMLTSFRFNLLIN